jgi:glucose-6-phosphate isomerase
VSGSSVTIVETTRKSLPNCPRGIRYHCTPVTFSTHPASLQNQIEHACVQLQNRSAVAGLWARRLDLWSRDPSVQEKIAHRLGWLSALDAVEPHISRLHACAASIRQDAITDIVLLGMGGSSLAPEVLRAVIGVTPGFPRFTVLDSVDPDAVRAAMSRPQSTIFLLASKSGSTIEPNVLAAEALRRLGGAGIVEPGSRVIAITDRDTALHHRALDERFRDLFLNPPDIGGRFSALSFFGLVPAAMMGIDVEKLIVAARAMIEACRIEDPRLNPGFALGAFMAAAALAGRDKVTLTGPERLEPFGLWVEQLVAESTGKEGKGVVPIAGEAPSPLPGPDRAFVRITLGNEPNGVVEDDSVPVMTLNMPDAYALGAEFFRWEVATSAAGILLDINPFDEPNVAQAKTATRTLLDTYTATRRLPLPEADAAAGGVRLTLSDTARAALTLEGPLAFLKLLQPGDYFGLLAYLPSEDSGVDAMLRSFRTAVAARTGCATMLGYGPRYLHSTGQLHKGGPNTGVFVIVTADPGEDLAIPGEPFSFGVLEQAQAAGDFDSLARAGRRVLLVHSCDRSPERLQRMFEALI